MSAATTTFSSSISSSSSVGRGNDDATGGNSTRSNNNNYIELRRLLTKFDFQPGVHQSYYNYGTAGFRYLATELQPIMVRVGIAAALLSQQQQQQHRCNAASSCSMGVMITASHNTVEYNGVKLAGMDGGMIDMDSETLTVQIVNNRNIDSLLDYIQQQQQDVIMSNNNTHNNSIGGIVHIGRDTREHSISLSCLVGKAVVAMGCCHVMDHGVVTTPMLHHAVAHSNAANNYHLLPTVIPLRLNTIGYYDLLLHSYIALLATQTTRDGDDDMALRHNPILTVDCACGVGFPHLEALIARLAQQQQSPQRQRIIVATNAPGSGPLNEGCGSEHVQKEQRICTFYNSNNNTAAAMDANIDDGVVSTTYCASLDGDADRIVFFYQDSADENGFSFTLLDGDKMACLIGNFIQEQLSTVIETCASSTATTTSATTKMTPLPSISLGVVQTAYANGASTQYLQSQGVQTFVAKTGVKYVHAAAHDNFDVGVYFEANGHGTVVFSPSYYNFLYCAETILRGMMKKPSSQPPPGDAAVRALQRLRVLPALINQSVGDALSDLLLVDGILQIQNWTIQYWAQALYQDLPSRQLKVKVVDRTVIQTNDNETMCTSPPGVQEELQRAMDQCTNGRAFVRPSGTEDVVRIYAEAATTEQANELATKAAEIVYRLCGGIGDAPHSRM